MINLLPPHEYSELKASRQNSLLIRYVIASFIVLLGVIAVHFIGFILIEKARADADHSNLDNTSKAEKYARVKQATNNFTQDLTTAKQILSNKTSYTDMLFNIARVLPGDIVLQSLSLNQDFVGKPLSLSIRTKSYEDAIRLKNMLVDSKIATNISIVSIINESTPAAGNDTPSNPQQPSSHPYLMTLNLTFTDKIKETTKEKN